MKFKKLISLICTTCIVSTYAFLPGFGGSTASAAAADMASCITSSSVPKDLWKSNCTLTGNGTASVTATGTSTGSMSSYPAFSFDTKALGSGTDTIMHLSWTIDNPSNLTINYRYQDSKGKYDLAKWTDTTNWYIKDQRAYDASGSSKFDFTAHVNPASYRADWFINLQDRSYRLYFDNKLFSESSIQSGATSLKNMYLDVQAAANYSFTINDPSLVIYGEGATMNDVVAYTFKQRSANNYYWVDNGMGNIDGTDGKRIVGNIDWVGSAQPSYSGSNVVVSTSSNADSGIAYKLRIQKSNGTYKEKGCLPKDSENDNIIYQSVTITPNLTGNNYAAIGFRGNQADALNKYKFGPDNGYVNGRAYHFDILVNNKDMKYWILVDGEKRATGDVGRDYLANISYTIHTSGSDTLLLSNIVTKSYDYTVSMDSLLDSLVNASNYNWTFDGFDLYSNSTESNSSNSIASGYNTRYNRVTFAGANSTGYTVTANEDAAYLQYRLGNGNQVALPANTSEDNIIHQHLSFTPYFASGNKLLIGIRGNNAWQEELLTVNADKGFVSGTEYDMDIIINNKNRSYMFIVDGAVKASGTSWGGRYPYWELVYYMDKSGDSMKLKNITTKYYKSSVSLYDLTSNLIEVNDVVSDFRFETDSNGYLAEELEDFACYDSTKWYVQTSKRFFSNNKALAPRATNTNDMATNPYISLNLSFIANKSGTNTYYMWVRHTASVINQDGRNFFLAIDADGTAMPNFKTYTAEAKAPRWMLLGSITLDQNDTGYVRIRERQSSHVAWDKYVITTNAGYTPTDAEFGIVPPSSSRAKNVGTLSGGRLVFEAENAGYGGGFELLDSYLDGNTYGWYTDYSGSKALMISSGNSGTPTNWNDSTGSIDAGDIEFNFTPNTSGSIYLWARYYASSTNKKFAVSVNSNDYVTVVMDESSTRAWQRIAAIDNVTAGTPINIRIANVAGGYVLDKFAITSSMYDTPSGASPSWETASTTLSGGSPTITVANLPSHPRLYFTDNEAEDIEEASHKSENSYMYGQNNTYITTGLREEFTGEIPASPGYQNYKTIAVARIEAMAYDYAINGNTASGEKAASSLINYITHVSYTGLSSDEFTRTAGSELFALSKAYDWCYGCLTSAQKDAFIEAGIKIASQLATGWPPSANSPMTGFASEGSFQSYLLAFAIAVANERPDIYNYVMDKMETVYVPAIKSVYNGTTMQGTRYGTFRGQHAFSAALMLKTIGYNDPDLYTALANTAMQYIYARRPDGLMFVDGDDTNNGKTPYSYYSVSHMKYMFLHAIKLFGSGYGVGSNSYFKEAAKWACYSSSGQFSNFDGTFGQESYVTPSTFLILNGNIGLGYEANYSLPLSRFFEGDVSSMFARTGWSEFTTSNLKSLDRNDNTAVAYMKVGQRNAGNHQHLDAGNFQLYYKGILANDPCYYTGTNYSSDYMNGYAKRSVAHNVVLVKDGAENSIGGLSFADGGQMYRPDATTAAAKAGSWEAHAVAGDDVNRPDFTYLKTNLQKSYRNVSSYKRSFMFLNMDDENEPASLIVFDRLGTSTAYQTAWLLHGLNRPTVSGKRAVFSTTTGGQMTNDTLLPASVNINTYADGYVDSSHNYSSGYVAESGKVNESEGYRIEVAPSSASTTTYFLNVVQAGDTGTTAASPALFESTDFYGVRLKDRVVLFNKGETWFGEAKDQEYLFNFSSSDGYVYKIAMADAYTGSYEIYWSANGSSYSLLAYAKTADDASHLLTFSGKAGYYKVVRKSNTTGGDTAAFATSNELKQLSPAVKIRQSGGNYIISASAKTYRTYAKPDSTVYANKIILTAYDQNGKVLGVKTVDFTTLSDEAAYVDIATLSQAPTGKIRVKSMLLDDLEGLEPLTKFGITDFLN